VTGVVTDGMSPVEGALVMQGGGDPQQGVTTGADGAYSIELTQMIPGTPTVVAAKIGYRTAGVEFYELPGGPVELALRFVTPPDSRRATIRRCPPRRSPPPLAGAPTAMLRASTASRAGATSMTRWASRSRTAITATSATTRATSISARPPASRARSCSSGHAT